MKNLNKLLSNPLAALIAFAVVVTGTLFNTVSVANATDYRSTHAARSGVIFENRRHGYRHHHRHYKKKKYHNRDYLLVERRRQIEARNRAVAAQDLIEKQIRAGVYVDNSLLFREERRSRIYGGAGHSGYATSACPGKHNCGYRLYEDGTGPRIIILGSGGAGINQPNDGLNGPKVITLD